MRGGWESSSLDTMSGTMVQQATAMGLPGSGLPAAYHNVMEARSPHAPWHFSPHGFQLNTTQVKQEPLDHDSSAYGSGSDGFHSSSPGGSDNHSRDSSDNQPTIVFNHDNMSIGQYYTTPITSQIQKHMSPYQNQNQNPIGPLAFNPLTPPSFEPSPMISPKHDSNSKSEQSRTEVTSMSLTPCTTPTGEERSKSPEENDEDHLRRLQMAFEKNGMMLPSPKGSENRDSDDGKSDYDMDNTEVDENGIRVPKVNSHGKVKTFKCKQCDFVAVTKLDFWEHSRAHIKSDKILTCPKCPFVTEYKHHLEYHLRNHFGSKPFKCDKCSYSCVNKSMLNSHLKSHSNVYQYRCADCTYATKYCHSLKLHLRKYKHNPAMVLNSDGTPNPLPIIDVYGTRRGPKTKSNSNQKESESPEIPKEAVPRPESPQNTFPGHSIFNPFMSPNGNNPPPFPFPWFGALGGAAPLLLSHLAAQNGQGQLSPNPSNDRSTPDSDSERDSNSDSNLHLHVSEESNHSNPPEESSESAVLDLSKPESSMPINMPINIPEVPTPLSANTSGKNRRKGRAFKLEQIQPEEGSSDEEMEIETSGTRSPGMERGMEPKIELRELDTENVEEESVSVSKTEEVVSVSKSANDFNCQYCDISFKDVVMYTMHMGYHGYKDPFTCNMCGEQSADRVAFFLHIARTSHS